VRTGTPPFETLQQKARDQRVTLTLVDPQQPVENVQLTALTDDSTSWRAPSGDVVSVPTSEVIALRLETPDRGRGALEGFGLGLVAGAIGGGLFMGLVAGAEDSDPDSGFVVVTPGEAIAIGAAGLGVVGGVVGLAVGAVRGSRTLYRIERCSPSAPTSSARNSRTEPTREGEAELPPRGR
jgi:hypothetical protein